MLAREGACLRELEQLATRDLDDASDLAKRLRNGRVDLLVLNTGEPC
jgi:hypothetical protein